MMKASTTQEGSLQHWISGRAEPFDSLSESNDGTHRRRASRFDRAPNLPEGHPFAIIEEPPDCRGDLGVVDVVSHNQQP